MWKDIEDFAGIYQVSDEGEVRSLDRFYCGRHTKGRILRPCLVGKGYKTVCLRKDLKTFRKYIHQLVAETFLPTHDEGEVVNHIDGNKCNNCINNLEWVTYSENNQHAYDNRLKPVGELFYNAKLTEEQVTEIRKNGKYGTYQEIADKYGVSKATIRDVLINKTWKHVK